MGNIINHSFRTRYPKANFVLSPDLANVQIEDMTLGNVHGDDNDIATELEAVRVASGNKFSVTESGNKFSVTHTAQGDVLNADSGTFLLEAKPKALESKSGGKVVEAFNLSGLCKKSNAIQQQLDGLRSEILSVTATFGKNNPVGGKSFVAGVLSEKKDECESLKQQLDAEAVREHREVDLLVDVVNETLTNLNLPTKPEVRYHDELKLLVVIGTQEQIDVTRKVVNALLDKDSRQ